VNTGYSVLGVSNPVNALISKRPKVWRPQFLGGDLALDFLNTRINKGGEVLDFFETDADVIAWLAKAGYPGFEVTAKTPARSLVHDAKQLRESIRLLVEKRKTGQRGDPSLLNKFLTHAQSHTQLIWKQSQKPILQRIRKQERPESILAPIAEAAALLLSSADFRLVKRCEGEGCLLWFSDQTKSHHRRWCSTSICGNRHKVAAYRKRRRDRLSSSV
jgi:predicted RNA-binding Zn ribbon-like protein